jgi:hypothetical protein
MVSDAPWLPLGDGWTNDDGTQWRQPDALTGSLKSTTAASCCEGAMVVWRLKRMVAATTWPNGGVMATTMNVEFAAEAEEDLDGEKIASLGSKDWFSQGKHNGKLGWRGDQNLSLLGIMDDCIDW